METIEETSNLKKSNKESVQNFVNSWKFSILMGALIGGVFFIAFFGIRVLDVTNSDWMVYEFDLTQHILGWKMYRNSGWHFPFGLCDTAMYPYLTSVVYTDSIPIVALFFKILSPILPDRFQYFGLYGLFCFMMQGGMAKILLRKYIKKEWVRNIGAVFFITCIVFVQRMFWQTALSSHYLILMALALYIYRDNIKSWKKKVILWCALGALSVSIHFYLYGMISVMLAGFALIELLSELPKVKKSIIVFLSYTVPYLIITVTVFYLFGGFYGSINVNDADSTIYPAYLNSLFDPKGFSIIFKDSSYGDQELEGFGYLGLAVLILFIPAIIAFIKDIKRIWKENKKTFAVSCLLVLFFFAFSLSSAIFWDGEYLFSVGVPDFIQKYTLGIFHSCGRFIWPVMYLFILIAIVYSEGILKKAYPYVLIAMMILQVVEFSGYFKEIFKVFDGLVRYDYPADVFENYDISAYKHIQLMKSYGWIDYYSDLTCYYEFVGYGELAVNHDLTISNFHFARDYDDMVQEQIDKSYDKLLAGNPDKDTFYVFPKDMYETNNLYGTFDNVYELDTGYDIVLIPKE